MKDHVRIILALLGGVVLFSLLGFIKSYFGLFPGFAGVNAMVHFHVFTVMAWFALIGAQAFLAGTGRLGTHRTLGRFSYAWVPVLMIGFVLATWQGQMKRWAPDLLGAAAFDGGLFLFFYLMAMKNRKDTTAHAQYMILTTLPFLNPGLGRFVSPALSVPLEFLIMAALLGAALYRKKPWKPYAVGMAAFVVGMAAVMGVTLGLS